MLQDLKINQQKKLMILVIRKSLTMFVRRNTRYRINAFGHVLDNDSLFRKLNWLCTPLRDVYCVMPYFLEKMEATI